VAIEEQCLVGQGGETIIIMVSSSERVPPNHHPSRTPLRQLLLFPTAPVPRPNGILGHNHHQLKSSTTSCDAATTLSYKEESGDVIL
jgi:hypothetical protein